MTDKKSSDSRRKLLKSIAAGTGAVVAGKNLPESWSRPVVDSVMLPAHAQTSPGATSTYSGSIDIPETIGALDPSQDTLLASIMNFVVPTASAGSQPTIQPISAAACATLLAEYAEITIQVILDFNGNTEFEDFYGLSRATFRWIGMIALPNGSGELPPSTPCDVPNGVGDVPSIEVAIKSITAGEIILTINGDDFPVPAGICNLLLECFPIPS